MAKSTTTGQKIQQRTLRRMNVRFLTIMMVLSLVVIVCVALLHRYQLRQFSGQWRQDMQAALEGGNIDKAITACTRYLTLYPNDTETLVQLGILLDENAASRPMLQQAFMTFETVLRQDDGRDKVRLRLVDVAIKLGRYSDALTHIEILNGQSASDAELKFKAGFCKEQSGKIREAAQLYSESILAADAKIEYFTTLASLVLLRQSELDLKQIDPLKRNSVNASQVAAQIMEVAVEKCRPSHLAYIARANFRKSNGDLDGAQKDIQTSLELAEDDPDVLLAAGLMSLERANTAATYGQPAEAAKYRETASNYARRGVDQDVRLYFILAQVLVETGKRSEAIALLNEAIARLPAVREQATADKLVQIMVTERQLLFLLADALISKAGADHSGTGEVPLKEPQSLLISLKKLSLTEPLVAFLEGRMFAANGKWHAAVRKFEQARQNPSQIFPLNRQIDLQLSACHQALESPDLRVLAMRRAVVTEPLWLVGRVEFANALADAGDFQEAIDEYRSLIRVVGVPIRLARLLTLAQIALPAEARDWTGVDQLLELARQTTPDEPDIPVLEAEVLTQQQNLDSAAAVLAVARGRLPDVVAIPVAQSLLELRRTDTQGSDGIAAALKFIDEATTQLGRKVELDLARAEVAIQVGGADGQRMLQEIQTSPAYDPESTVRLYEGLARAADRLNSPQVAIAFWKRIIELRPSNLRAHLELAKRVRTDAAAWKAELAAIRSLEGPEGPNGDFEEAVMLIESVLAEAVPATADSPQMKSLNTARTLLSRAFVQRPHWAAVPRALGRLEEASGNEDAAFEQCRTALEKGDRSRELVMKVVPGYMQRKRFDEADQVLQTLAQSQPEFISGDLARMAWSVAWQRNQLDRALELAVDVADGSEDFRDQIWLSELRFARGRRGAEVEEPLEEAIRLAPTAPEPWFAKVAYLTRIGRVETAEATIQTASTSIREEDAAITAARCYELISEFSNTENQYLAEAEKFYLKAFESRPAGDVERGIMVADFYIRNADYPKAEKYLAKLLDPKTAAPNFAVTWARRRQAMLIAARGGYDDTKLALEMLEQNEASGTLVPADDLRAHAEILSRRPIRSERLAAIRILEQLDQRKELETIDSFRLAILYEESGNWSGARKVILGLLAVDSPDPDHVVYFVDRLIRHDELIEAEAWMFKLEELQPKSFRTVLTRAKLLGVLHRSPEAVTILTEFIKDRQKNILGLPELLEQGNSNDALEVIKTWLVDSANRNTDRILLQVRELVQQQQTEQAVALLREHVSQEDLGDATHAAIMRVAADLLEEIGELNAAEYLFRQFATLSPRQEAAFILAKFLARQGRVVEALAVCEPYVETGEPELIASAVVSVVSQGTATPEHLQQVDAWIQAAGARKPDSLICGVALADLRLLQHRFDDAEKLYQLILTKDKENLVALNNLAWLFAHAPGQADQALDPINRALEIAGAYPALLDTRAMAYLGNSKFNEALKDLKEAFEGSDEAIGYLHLALAYLEVKDTKSAATAMAEAEKLGLRPDALHPLEREKLERVRKALPQQSG